MTAVAWVLAAAIAPAGADADALAAPRRMADEGHFAEAERLLRARLAERPEPEARFLLARVLAWQGRFEAALEQYDRLLEAAPRNADYMLGKGQTLVWAGRPEAAVPLLQAAQELSPQDPEVLRPLIRALDASEATRPQARALQDEARTRFPGLSWNLVAERPPSFELETGVAYEALSGGIGDWRTAYVEGQQHLGARANVFGAARLSERFALSDQQVSGGVAWPLYGPIGLLAEGSFSPTARVLPRYELGAQLDAALGGGWVADVGLKRTEFAAAGNWRGTLTLERYMGDWRLAYAFAVTQLPEGYYPLGHTATVSYMHPTQGSVTFGAAYGREMNVVGPDRLLTTDVLGVWVRGQYWLFPGWAIVPQLNWTQQGTLYDRLGGNLGLRHAF